MRAPCLSLSELVDVPKDKVVLFLEVVIEIIAFDKAIA